MHRRRMLHHFPHILYTTTVAMILLGGTFRVRSFVIRSYSIHRPILTPNVRLTSSSSSSSLPAKADEDSSGSTGSSSNPATQWTTDKVRSTFVQYFQGKDHTYQPSSPSAPLNDPTLLFTNAGMNQFKPIFLGQVDPNSSMATLSRACNSQKCIRAGGKHNDLEDVGRDTYHHTFFEMLGSWSFGDYFKKEAIDYAWELLTNVYQLEPDRIYATYFEGDDNVAADTMARDLWHQYLPMERVLPCSGKDNFWEMGDTGPCGPCTEIHYDRIGNRDAASLVNADDPDVIEIWNIVFIQYNREPGKLQPLPLQHVDTGMGLERLVSILQQKTSNYDIDCFKPLFDKIAEHSQVGAYTGRVGFDDYDRKDTAYRAIADHARTLAFAIADGAIPNNEGRGYVLRRILRRATRYGQQILKAEPGFFVTLIPVVVKVFGNAYPELVKQQDTILEIVAEEEQAFGTMLQRGIKYFDELREEIAEKGESTVDGMKAFFMYDTLGFPIDLTELMAEEVGLTVDTQRFQDAMQEQKERSRSAQREARAGGTPVLELIAEQTSALTQKGVLPTDDSFKYVWDKEPLANVMAVFADNGAFRDDEVTTGEFVGLVLNKSSFYAEAGGQEADSGSIVMLDETGNTLGTFAVTDVQVYGGFVLHKGLVKEGTVKVGSTVKCRVDYDRRRLIAPNHSMTHVLNAALRQVLGDGVEQRGSLCNEEKLRFDFSHKKSMTPAQLQQVEAICRDVVAARESVSEEIMPLEDAKKIEGVRAVFGEIYPDPVRVISIGENTSVEFCGGTHITNTAEAEAFAIVEETSVAKGIRRITAVTRRIAADNIKSGENFVTLVEKAEKLPPDTLDLEKDASVIRRDLDAAVVPASLKSSLRARVEDIQKKASEATKKALQKRVNACLEDVKKSVQEKLDDNSDVLILNVDIAADPKSAQTVQNTVRKLAPEIAFLGLSEEVPGSGGKVLVFATVPDLLIDNGLKADEWINAALKVVGGQGGGKAGSAQGQAKECSDITAVYNAARSFAGEKSNAKV